MPANAPLLRIGELSARVGVSAHLLRAWENRYGVLQPVRSPGGFRLYSPADEDRIRRMQAHLANGLAAAQAARIVLLEDNDLPEPVLADPTQPAVADLGTELARALDAFDEAAAHAVIDRLLAELSLTTVMRDVLVPYLAELGERWHAGTASVAQEHFASNVIRGRLAGLARGWGSGHGPRATLACPPGELHDLALMIFGIVLNRNGWTVDYLGMDTPVEDVAGTAEATHADLVVLASTSPENLKPLRRKLAKLGRRNTVVLAGAGATAEFARAVGARYLPGDPATEAVQLATATRRS